jgi:hypothetical protein
MYVSKFERFWIKFILRFAIGFLFLFAAIGQFNAGGEPGVESARTFAKNLSGGFKSTWIADVQLGQYTGLDVVQGFLFGLPFAFLLLSAMILTGIGVRIALRAGAILLICLGLGKYMQGPEGIATTANDFLFALIICIGLFFYGLEKQPVVVMTQPHPPPQPVRP